MVDTISISAKQISRMAHAIGLDNKEPENGVYNAYRNCSVYDDPVDDWEQLVNLQLAHKKIQGKQICYSLTVPGLRVIAKAKGLLIRFCIEVGG